MSTKTQVSWAPTALVHQRRGDRGVHAARQRAQDALLADLGADRRDLFFDDRDVGPGRRRAPRRGAGTLRAAPGRARCGRPRGGTGRRRGRAPGSSITATGAAGDERGDDEARGGGGNGVAVAHPARGVVGPIVHQTRRAGLASASVRPYSPSPVLATSPPSCRAMQLGAVTDAEDRHAEVVDRRVERRRRVLVDGLGTAREDDRRRGLRAHLVGRDRARDDLGVDVRFANAPSDELGVLRTEVNDEDAALNGPMPTPWERCIALPSVCSDGASMTSAFWNSFRVS